MHKLLLSLLLLALGLSARAQRACDMWYLGNYAALRFNPGGTKLITGSAMQMAEGTAGRCFTEAECRAGTASTS
jgi:hypothetical protein